MGIADHKPMTGGPRRRNLYLRIPRLHLQGEPNENKLHWFRRSVSVEGANICGGTAGIRALSATLGEFRQTASFLQASGRGQLKNRELLTDRKIRLHIRKIAENVSEPDHADAAMKQFSADPAVIECSGIYSSIGAKLEPPYLPSVVRLYAARTLKGGHYHSRNTWLHSGSQRNFLAEPACPAASSHGRSSSRKLIFSLLD
jgi:hypothetical protein